MLVALCVCDRLATVRVATLLAEVRQEKMQVKRPGRQPKQRTTEGIQEKEELGIKEEPRHELLRFKDGT